jgi:hypothetical protein
MSLSLAVVTAVNDEKVLRSNLSASPMIRNGRIPLILEKGHRCAGQAYNAGMSHVDAEVIVFAHQDVFLPEDWLTNLEKALKQLYQNDPNWGVAGCWGVTKEGQYIGYVYSSGLKSTLGKPFGSPAEVRSLDEMILILRRASGLRFNEQLPHFHFYGTDICMSAIMKGYKCYVIPAFCIHNSNPIINYPREFYDAYRYVKTLWRGHLPIQTTCINISRMDSEYWLSKFKQIVGKLIGSRRTPPEGRVQDPEKLWKELQSIV